MLRGNGGGYGLEEGRVRNVELKGGSLTRVLRDEGGAST
jgi:hypothetical protein